MFEMQSFPMPRRLLATPAAAGAAMFVVLAVLAGRAISAQDKYTLQVPNGLAFSEFEARLGRIGFDEWLRGSRAAA